MIITFLFGFGIIIFWKSCKLLKKAHRYGEYPFKVFISLDVELLTEQTYDSVIQSAR